MSDNERAKELRAVTEFKNNVLRMDNYIDNEALYDAGNKPRYLLFTPTPANTLLLVELMRRGSVVVVYVGLDEVGYKMTRTIVDRLNDNIYLRSFADVDPAMLVSRVKTTADINDLDPLGYLRLLVDVKASKVIGADAPHILGIMNTGNQAGNTDFSDLVNIAEEKLSLKVHRIAPQHFENEAFVNLLLAKYGERIDGIENFWSGSVDASPQSPLQ